MDAILELLGGSQGRTLIDGASKQLGIDGKQASKAMTAAMPLILAAMKNNASSESGASGLMKALNSPKHSSGSVLDNLGSILGGDSIDDDVLQDGDKILGHVFNGQQGNAANAIGKSSGINMDSAMQLMKVAAPVVLSYLARQSKEKNVSDQSGIDGLLGGLLGGSGSAQQTAASVIQGFDNNDSSIDDIAEMLTGKSGGLGGMLGGFLKNL